VPMEMVAVGGRGRRHCQHEWARIGTSSFWPSNYNRSLVLTIELKNQESLAIKLLKPLTIGHQESDFVDVDATWRWGTHASHISLFLSLSLSSLSATCNSPTWAATFRRRGSDENK
jgi:hypothetical protein